MRVLSIDAWGNQIDGFEWNNWHYIGQATTCDTLAECVDSLIELYYIDPSMRTKALSELIVVDDGYNMVVCYKETQKPIYAFEYGYAV